MSTVRFCADLHLSHKSMAIKRGFTTAEDHDNLIIENWNKVVHKRDVTYILGDVTMEKKAPYHLLDKLNGTKHVVLGNHDRRQDVPALLNHVQSVSGMLKYMGNFLTHCPVHPSELEYRVRYNIHGHIHAHTIDHPRYICVSMEQIEFTPKTLTELLDKSIK